MIIIRPQAGLGNRLRAIDSAVALSDKINSELEIRWVKNYNLNCSLLDLFVLTGKFRYKEYSCFFGDNGRIERILLPFNKIIKKIFMPGIKFYSNSDIKNLKKKSNFLETMLISRNIWIQTETSFLNNPSSFSYLKPADEIENIVTSITKNYSNNTIGIHIRRSDNIMAIKKSPTECFVKEIEIQLKQNEQSKFFLATDSIEEEMKLKKMFGDAIITYTKRSYDRNTSEAIKDALVDMLCLSRTKMILGSFYSSFSEISASIGKIPLMVINNYNTKPT